MAPSHEWRKAREHEIQLQNAIQLTYDWTFTTPYTCTVVLPPAVAEPGVAAAGEAAGPGSVEGGGGAGSAGVPDFVCGPTGPLATAAPSAAAFPMPFPSARRPPPPPPTFAATANGPATTAAQPPNGVVPTAASAATGDAASPSGAASVQAGTTALQHAATPASEASASAVEGEAGGGSAPPYGQWQSTAELIDRGLLMERDPILFFDEVPLYESDLDDNGVCAVTVKLRVMPRCWLVLLRLWMRVDGSMVRLRETRLFCRHDKPDKRLQVLQEVKHCEGAFPELRARGAPDEGAAYTDADAASQVFQAVAPVGLRLMQTRKLLLPPAAPGGQA
ncbi:TIP41-like protein [Tetrabaena socialis]|uniref:TIP41-like protein n=1 Tax=Tetrabaena socialis TaxID=47790 RepID=A0A2J8A855_9CHLO|nr:TIP41-like protein [Tetrabaena socialis]|eukprot:PNH08716.1 TIP41-like protein [Tetrabaena socialis]